MIRRLCLAVSLLMPLHRGALAADGSPSSTPARPNFLIIVADDLGLECVGAYGGMSYKTPHIDRLAGGGVRFTHCFANPLCSPSRAQLLTGRYPLHNGIPRVIYDLNTHREFLDPAKEISFANLLRKTGYATAIAGKWQLSFLHERDTINAFGFDEYQCWQIWDGDIKTSRFANPVMRQNGEVRRFPGSYGPDENLAFLTDFIQRHRDQPFCAYYTCLLPHYPWEPTPGSGVPLRPAADGLGDKRFMPDMVAYLDQQVGCLVATLDELGLRDNTVVIFVADNGTDRRITSAWTDGSATRNVAGGKGTMTDAGTRVPLIVNCPAKFTAGRVVRDLVDLSDMLPTLMDLAAIEPGPLAINGRSFAPQLHGQTGSPRTWVHAQNQGDRHVRNFDYILTNHGGLRPVVDIGINRAGPLTGPLTDEQSAARDQLDAALESAAQSPVPH